jgi:signal transduction histidine kinase
VLPAHLFIQLPTGWPLSLIAILFLTNCLEAVIGAGLMRFLTNTPWRIDTLRGLIIFLGGAVVIGPLLSSFADAAAVTWLRGEAYWVVWGNRTLSNVLSELTVVPAVLGAAVSIRRWRYPGVSVRAAEAAILGLGLCAITLVGYSEAFSQLPAVRAVSSQMPLALQLPFLLWVAVRFGSAGAGIAVFTTSTFSAWAVVHGAGPFESVAPSTTLTALRLSLVVVAATLLSVATLMEERRQTQQALATRLEFESLLARLASALVQQPTDEMHRAFEAWLGRIARLIGIDAVTVFTGSQAFAHLTPLYSWMARGITEAPGEVAAAHARWARRSVQLQDAILIPGTRDPLLAVGADRHSADGAALSGGAIPLVGEGELLGALTFSSFGEPPDAALVPANAWLIGEVLAAALRRRLSEDALRKSEAMKSAILQSLTTGVAVIDREGRLLQVNGRWRDGVPGCDWLTVGIGDNLLASCRAMAEAGNDLAAAIEMGVTAVLDQSHDRFAIERMSDLGADARWWSLTAIPLYRMAGGAVLVAADITDLRRAEMEAQRSRLELAHVARVSTVGEMTASLAHQLNQPLAAIMTNAQAAGRMLNTALPDVDEVRAILQDIVRDDRRASDVIDRLRQLLRKGELEMRAVSLSTAIREVVELLGSEAIIRNVAIALDFSREPILVHGDRVQLQQVILNLLHNAMEALADEDASPRAVCVTCRDDGQTVTVCVRDSGPGLRAGTEEAVFEPFYTTKSGGMGMGLSIVRSIVEAHGGSIRARNAQDGGAVVEFQLPLASAIPTD